MTNSIIKTVEDTFITTGEMATDSGNSPATVHNWLKYFRYMPFDYMLGKPVVKRTDYEKFKREHPDLIRSKVAA